MPISTPPPPNPVHDALKSGTLSHHEDAERAFARFDLGQRAGYAGFLRAQAAAVLTIEALAERTDVAALLPDWADRRRGPSLRADIAQLGLAVPAPADVADLAVDPLGLAYVLEGSRHGARILHRRVLAGGDTPSIAATAFLGQAFDRARWTLLLETLRQQRAGQLQQALLTRTAVFAFDMFRASALAQPGDAPQPPASFGVPLAAGSGTGWPACP